MSNKNRSARNKRISKQQERNSKMQDFASSVADPKGRLKATSSVASDKSTIGNYLERPYDNAANIANALEDASIKSGTFEKVLQLYQSIPTYNHTISPVLGNKLYDFSGNMSNDFIDVAYTLSQYNIKFFAPYFFKEMLKTGVTYQYKITDSKGIAYMKFPVEWCKIRALDQGVYRFMIDVSKLRSEIYDSMPKEIQTAMDNYNAGKARDDDGKKWYDGKWYFVGDKGAAFTLDPNALTNGGVAISPFAGMLIDNLSLQNAKDNVDIKDNLDTIRLIHSKIPTDSDGVPTMNLKTAKIFDSQMRKNLPDGVVAISSPNNIDNVPLTGSGNAGVYDTVNKANEQLFYSLGVSSSLFGGNTTSSNIIKEEIKKEANWIYTNLFPMLENYYNYELLKNVKTSTKIPWHIKFIRQSQFTLKDDIANLKDQLSYGGSRLDYLAACGFEPAEVYSKLKFEQQVLDIDSIMVVKPTSNTISAATAQQTQTKPNAKKLNNKLDPNAQEVGRPTTDEPTDDTDRINDSN